MLTRSSYLLSTSDLVLSHMNRGAGDPHTAESRENGSTEPGHQHSQQYSSDSYVSANQAASVLGISPKTLANARVYGNSPPYAKVFGRIRYRVADLTEYINARRRNSTSEEGRRK